MTGTSDPQLVSSLKKASESTPRRAWQPYVVAIALIAAAAALRLWPLQALGASLAWLTFYPAVMVAALYGGLSAGLLGAFLSCLAVLFLLPIFVGQPFIRDSADWLGLAVFFITCTMISGVAEALHRARAREKHANDQLEAANIKLREEIDERKQAAEAVKESEQRLDLALGSAQMGAWDLDLVNDTAVRSLKHDQIFGYPSLQPEWGSEIFLTHVVPDDRDLVKKRFEEAFATGHFSMECRIIWPDQSLHSIAAQGRVYRNQKGDPVRMMGVVTDISERKRAEEALRASEARYHTLFDSIDEGYCVIEVIFDEQEKPVDYRFLEINSAFEKQTGLIGAQGKRMRELAPGHEEYWFEIYGRIALSGEPARFQNRAEQLRRWYDVYAFRYGEPKNRHVAILFNDITERKQAEDAIRRLNEDLQAQSVQLEAANKELEAFSYSVSHDLRAPLRHIDGFSQILLEDYDGKLDDEGRRYLQQVREASQQMARLIDDMLNLSRVTRAEMRRETVDLSRMAKAVAEALRKTQPDREVEFVIEKGLVTEGDERLLRVALDNLLGNAWKYTGKRPQARIEFGRTNHDSRPAYFVRDNGVGFDMAYTHKLFGAFQRLHSVAEFPGTGIGLATVQRIIHRHGGQVWAEGAVNRGATFYFTL